MDRKIFSGGKGKQNSRKKFETETRNLAPVAGCLDPPVLGPDAVPDERNLAKATTNRSRNMQPRAHVRPQEEIQILHRGRGSHQGPTDTLRTGVEMDKPSASRTL